MKLPKGRSTIYWTSIYLLTCNYLLHYWYTATLPHMHSCKFNPRWTLQTRITPDTRLPRSEEKILAQLITIITSAIIWHLLSGAYVFFIVSLTHHYNTIVKGEVQWQQTGVIARRRNKATHSPGRWLVLAELPSGFTQFVGSSSTPR